MEAKIGPASVFFVATLGLCALALVYSPLPVDFGCMCNPRVAESPRQTSVVVTRAKDLTSSHSTTTRTPLRHEREITIAQFLQEKVAKGISGDDLKSELQGLDTSSRALLRGVLRSLTKVDPSDHKKGQIVNFDEYGVARVVRRLVVYSAYRTSLRDITVVTLSPDFTLPTSSPDFKNLPPKDPAVKRTCMWLADGGPEGPRLRSTGAVSSKKNLSLSRKGVAEFRWVGEHHGTSYDVLLINCSFPEAVGTELTGGSLYLNITQGSHDSSPTELAPVFHEQPRTLNISLYDGTNHDSGGNSKFQYEFAYCSPAVFTAVNHAYLKQFLMYHYAILGGSVHFFIYDSQGIDHEAMDVLRPLIAAGILTVVDFRKEREYHTWYHSQNLAINDCLYRTRFLAKWSLFWDLDEYLNVLPPAILPSLLQQHADVPWISFGKIEFSLNYCASNFSSEESTADTVWAVERMVYRQKDPVGGERVEGPMGSRKWMANPRKVSAGKIHDIVKGADSGEKGLVLPVGAAHMSHYRGLPTPPNRPNCAHIRETRNSSELSDSSTTIVEDGKKLIFDPLLATMVSSTIRSQMAALSIFGGDRS